MQSLHILHCFSFNILYNQHGNWCLFCLLQIQMFLNMIMSINQKIINHIILGEVKQTEIKNRTYYFYNNMISLKSFEPNLLKIDKKSYENIGSYNIGYTKIKKNDDYILCICVLIMQTDILKKKWK